MSDEKIVVMAQAFVRGRWVDFQHLLSDDHVGEELDKIAAFEERCETAYAGKPLRAVKRTLVEEVLEL